MSSLSLSFTLICVCVRAYLSAPGVRLLSLSLPNEVFFSTLSLLGKLHFLLDTKTRDCMFATSSSTASSSRATINSSPVLREKKQRRFVFFARRNGENRVSSSSSPRASTFGILTAAAQRGGGERKNGNEDDEAEEEAITKRKERKSLVASSAAMMTTTTTVASTAFAAEEAVSSLAEGTNGTLESVRLVVALSSIALILFQGPKGDGVVNTLSEKRVFSSAKNAKSAVDYVTYALIGGFIVLSAVLAVG